MNANRSPWRPVAIALLATLAAPTAQAIDPTSVRYLPDHDAMFWFIQVTDTHIGTDGLIYDADRDTQNLDWVTGEAYSVVAPEFIVLTGDIVDATILDAPVMQQQEEWDEYRDLVDGNGMVLDVFHDVVGNHDAYLDEGLTYYLGNSIIGEATGAWHSSWTESFGFGDYLFVGLCSADTTGSSAISDSPGFEDGELLYFQETLMQNASAELAFVFSHHTLADLDFGDDAFMGLLDDNKVSAWANGHLHEHSIEFRDSTMHFNLSSSGKADTENFAVFAVDNNGLSVKQSDIGVWPYVQITSPVDVALGGGNPYAHPVSLNATDNFVRALVFSPSAPTSVTLAIDGAGAIPMTEVAPSVWQGEWDATGLDMGVHELRVTAETPEGTDDHAVDVDVLITECDDGIDNDGNGVIDYPDDGGCWGTADTEEDGWVPPDDPETPGDDDDSASVGDDDDNDGIKGGCGCATTVGNPVAGGALLMILGLTVAVTRRREGPE